MKPRHQVLEDIEVLTELADVIDCHTELGRRYAVGALLEEFRTSLLAELDYRREADNLEAVGAMLAEHERLVVPTPYPDFTTSRVLTMEYIEGTKITDLGPHPSPAFDGAALADDLVRLTSSRCSSSASSTPTRTPATSSSPPTGG